jgi:hypothetical protein
VAGNNTLALPSGNGSANQLLKNSGTAGALAFATATEDSSGNLAFNSGYGSVATAYGCRAWVNFDGSTSPGTIRASGNVSSVTRNGTGDYTVNFTTAMPDTNYAAQCDYGFVNAVMNAGTRVLTTDTYTTSSLRIKLIHGANNVANSGNTNVSIFR